MIRAQFDGKNYQQIEDHTYDQFIAPKVDKSKAHEYAEEAFGKAKDKLKDAYIEEVKRQATTRSKKELESYGKKIAERVSGAIDAAEFSIAMIQKYVMWNDAQRTISTMLNHIKKIKMREKCSYVKAFNIYLGKEKMSSKSQRGSKKNKKGKNPLSFHPNYVDPMSPKINKKPPTLQEALSEIPSGYKRSPYRSPNQCYDAFLDKKGKPSGCVILYSKCTKKIAHITTSYKKYYKVTAFHANQKASSQEYKTSYPHNKRIGIMRAWLQNGSISHWLRYKNGELLTEIRFNYGGKPSTVYYYEGGKKTGAIRYSYSGNGARLIEAMYMYKGKVLKREKY